MAVEQEKKTVATPWGQCDVVERVLVAQRAGDQRFSSTVELLASPRGEQLVRFAYTTEGVVRRGPVTLRTRDLARLGVELGRCPRLAALLAPLAGGDA